LPCPLLPLRAPLPSSFFPYTTLFRSLSSIEEHLARVEDSVRVEGSLDAPHHLDRLRCEREVQIRRFHVADAVLARDRPAERDRRDRKSTRLNSSHQIISYAVFCLKKK